MTGDIGIEWNQDFFDNLLKEEGVVQVVEQVAQQALIAARATAPVKSEDYRDSIHLERHDTRYRTLFRIRADDKKASLIEAKTGNLHKALAKAKI